LKGNLCGFYTLHNKAKELLQYYRFKIKFQTSTGIISDFHINERYVKFNNDFK